MQRSWTEVIDRSCQLLEKRECKNMEFGEMSPPNLYKSSVLREAKQQHKDDILGVTQKNQIESIIELKGNSRFSGSIHEAGINPLLMNYCTGHQLTKIYVKIIAGSQLMLQGDSLKKLRIHHYIFHHHIFFNMKSLSTHIMDRFQFDKCFLKNKMR